MEFREARPADADALAAVARSSLRASYGHTVDAAALEDEMERLRLSPGDVMDIVIPAAAQALGRMWEEDEAGFLEVSLACARLQELCRRCSHAWQCDPAQQDCTGALVAVVEGEDHILGAIVLADQLRRRRMSVQVQFQATPQSILDGLRFGSYDCVFFSAATEATLGRLCEVLRAIKDDKLLCPTVAVGGQVLNYKSADVLKSEVLADYLTNDVEEVLSAYQALDEHVNRIIAESGTLAQRYDQLETFPLRKIRFGELRDLNFLYLQTGRLAPADKTIYGIRAVTATVESVPLITASILS